MSKSKDIIGLVVHEEFTKARKAIEASLDQKLSVQLNEFFPALAAAIPAIGSAILPAAKAALPAVVQGVAQGAGQRIGNSIGNAANTGTMEEDGCQGEDCMHEDDEDEKDGEEDEGEEDEDEGEEDEDEKDGKEDEGEENEDEDEDEGEEDQGNQESPEDSSMRNRQAMIGFRAANKKGDKQEMNEARGRGLKGNQEILDKAPPFGKLTRADFEALRANKGK